MTDHSFVDYKCKYCGANFVPMLQIANCPNCGLKSEKIFDDFIDEVIGSALFNISSPRYKNAFPGAWAVCNIGDWYYKMTFLFIIFVSEELKIEQIEVLHQEYSEITAQSLSSHFLETIDFGSTDYLKNHLKVYLPMFLKTSKAHCIRLADEAKKVVDEI